MNRSLLDQLNSPLIVLLIVMVAYLLFIVARLANSEGDPSYFVYAGRTFTDPAAVPQGLRVYPLFRRDGYDGQFYYRLALNPFTTERTDFGITIDNPAYRHQRIFYPLLTWMLSLGGRPTLVPITLIAVNFFALCAIGWIGAAYMRLLKQHALWGTAFAFSPNFLYSLSLDLTEILATCLVLAGLLAIRREKAHRSDGLPRAGGTDKGNHAFGSGWRGAGLVNGRGEGSGKQAVPLAHGSASRCGSCRASTDPATGLGPVPLSGRRRQLVSAVCRLCRVFPLYRGIHSKY
jgi:hypothetical protein